MKFPSHTTDKMKLVLTQPWWHLQHVKKTPVGTMLTLTLTKLARCDTT